MAWDDLPRGNLQWNDLLPNNHSWDNIPEDITLQDNLLLCIAGRCLSSFRNKELSPLAALRCNRQRNKALNAGRLGACWLPKLAGGQAATAG